MTTPTDTSPRRVAIMQPYLFPYLGYFQLIAAVDEFWLFDTVQYIQRGWMNRNAFLLNGRRTLFTIPVKKSSRSDNIISKVFAPSAAQECAKLEKTLRQSYAKAAYVETALSVVREFGQYLERTSQPVDFTSTIEASLRACLDAIGLDTRVRRVSSLGLDETDTGQDHIIAACKAIGAQEYINMIGGRALYEVEKFAAADIGLSFLEPAFPVYDQGHESFEPSLSILDILARVPPEGIRSMLQAATLEQA